MRTLLYKHENLTIHSITEGGEPNYLFLKLLGELGAELKIESSGAVRKLAEMPLFDEDVEAKKAFVAIVGWADEQDKRKLGLNEDRFDLAHPSEQMELEECWLIWNDRATSLPFSRMGVLTYSTGKLVPSFRQKTSLEI